MPSEPRVPTFPEPIVCSEFWRNRRGESVRVQLYEYEGQVLVDLRVHCLSDGKLVPTQKGVSLVVRKLPELLAGDEEGIRQGHRTRTDRGRAVIERVAMP